MGQCASQPRTHPDDQAGGVKQQEQQQQRQPAQQQQQQAPPGPQLDVHALDDDTLGAVLGLLPLAHLVQLSTASRRLFQLIQRSDKVLKTVDLQPLAPQQLEPALAFLAAHPGADAVHTATLPSNCAGSAAALRSLAGVEQLTLFRAARVAQPEPPLPSLPLSGLPHLASLALTLESGDVPAGSALCLPPGLRELAVSAPSLGAAINPLPITSLGRLTTLTLAVLDTTSAKALPKLLALPALQHLRVGRFWHVPDVLHTFAGLRSLEVSLYGKVSHAAMGELEMPLSAAACGLTALPTRPNLQLTVNVSLLAACDGLAPDWAGLCNLRSLSVDNIYPVSRGFSLAPLTGLGRLAKLALGFEAQQALDGTTQRLELHELHELVHLKELSVTCSGPMLELAMEAPRYLHSLLVACDGTLLLAAPGTAAAAAAAAAKRAADSQLVMRLSLEAPGSPTGAAPPGSPTQPQALAQLGSGQLPAAGGGSGALSPQGSFASSAGSGSEALFCRDPLSGSDCSAVLMMQRHLDRLGSIGEMEEAHHVEGEAEQLCHITRLGLLTGRGLRLRDPQLLRYLGPAAVTAAASSTCGRAGSGHALGRARSGGRAGSFRGGGGGGGSDVGGDSDVLPFDAWLSAKGLHLDALQLVQQRLAAAPHGAAAAAAAPRAAKRGGGWAKRGGGGGKDAGSCPQYQLLARCHMQDDLLTMFRQWGFVR